MTWRWLAAAVFAVGCANLVIAGIDAHRGKDPWLALSVGTACLFAGLLHFDSEGKS